MARKRVTTRHYGGKAKATIKALIQSDAPKIFNELLNRLKLRNICLKLGPMLSVIGFESTLLISKLEKIPISILLNCGS